MSSSRPSGTVTFLFSDIEGSTTIAQQHPEAWIKLRERHDALMHSGIRAHDGYVFQIVGDQFCAAFHTAVDAVLAAVEIQRAMSSEPWSPVPIKVRIGLHSGTAQTGPMDDRTGGYNGYAALASTQRVMSTAHGGQILLSNTTAELVRADMPDDISLVDMGEHRLKGLTNVQHLWQVYAVGLEREFPALKSLNAIPNNLPIQLTGFIGRAQAIADLRTELEGHRLVTLCGPGGTGKTRLALRVGAEVIDSFPNGVWFVELAPIADERLVPQAVAYAMGIREQAGQSIRSVLVDHAKDRRLLIILDNCEHLLGACADLVGELLASAPGISVLATSRESLHIGGERVYQVPPLSFPDPAQISSVGDLAGYESLQLFIDRALDAQPAFEVTDENAGILADVCQTLDGIPFAIELAAARTRSLSIQAIADRLDDRFRLLAHGDRTAVPRQQTLRALLDWSYDLLTEPEQRLLGRLSVFRSGWTLGAAEAVAADEAVDAMDVVDLLSSLVNKSLVTMDINSARYNMLETARQYGLERLSELEDEERFHRNHAEYFAALAEAAAPHLAQTDQVAWLERLGAEHDNLRAALRWALEGDLHLELAMRLVSAVTPFWVLRGHLREGYDNATAVLARIRDDADLDLRTAATLGAAHLAYRQNSLEDAGRWFEEGLDLARQLGDKLRIGEALEGLGNVATEVGDYRSAPARFAEAHELYQQAGDTAGIAGANMNLAWAAMRQGDNRTAERYLLEALDLYKGLGDQPGLGFTLSGLGEVYLRQSKVEQALDTLQRSLDVRKSLGDKWGMGATLGSIGWAHLMRSDLDMARRSLEQSLDLRREIGDKGGTAWCLEKLAEVAAGTHQLERAVQIYGAANALRESIGSVIDPADIPAYEERLASLRKELGDQAFEKLWMEGAETPLSKLVEAVRKDPAP